jgi:hypothetical protein
MFQTVYKQTYTAVVDQTELRLSNESVIDHAFRYSTNLPLQVCTSCTN